MICMYIYINIYIYLYIYNIIDSEYNGGNSNYTLTEKPALIVTTVQLQYCRLEASWAIRSKYNLIILCNNNK